jgi:cytochrome c
MDSFELNKIMGAVLGTLLFVMGAGFVAEAIYHPIEDRGPGYALPEPELVAAAGEVPAEAEVPLGVLLASASVERGATAVRKCQSCHNFGEGEANKAGPVLYDTVGKVIASHDGFSYSDALLAHNAAGDTWTYENLNAFLTSPAGFAPGTKMTFAGIRTAEERADIMAYLQTLSANPVPFPEAEAVAVAEGDAAAPAEGAAPAAEGEQVAAMETPAAPASPLDGLPVAADAERGAAAARKCQACHNFLEGEANKLGPALYDTVGKLIASHEGFAYSDALLAHNAAGDTWTFANLDAFLTSPAGFAPGTKMGFPGIANENERADLIAYMQTLSNNPVPRPGEAGAEAAPAEGTTSITSEEPNPVNPEAVPGVETLETPLEPATTEQDVAPAAPGDAAPAAADADAPAVAPARAIDTPTQTQTDTPVVGTPTTTTQP